MPRAQLGRGDFGQDAIRSSVPAGGEGATAMALQAVPRVSPIFVARELELARLNEALAQIPVALICGVAGVGKSALALALAARWRGTVIYRKAASEPLATLVDDLRRQLARGGMGEVLSNEERILDLVDRLESERCLCVLDDLHELEPSARADLMGILTRSLRRARALITSREKLVLAGSASDWFQLLLEGLDKPAAQVLWRSLDALYGPAAGFEQAWDRCKGNPFQLRRAHAGGLDDDPVGAAVRALPPDERLVASALAVSQIRLPISILAGLLAGERARAALRRLTSLLIADVDGHESVGIHDLFRDALLKELAERETERHQIHALLARLLPDAELDEVVVTREVRRHLCARGDFVAAGRYLVQHAAHLVRSGATAELLRGLDAIPAAHRTPEVRLVRARCFTRLLDLTRAYEELDRLVSELADSHELKLALAQLALAHGRLEVAERHACAVREDPTASRKSHLDALLAQALVLTHRGSGDEGRRLLSNAEAEAGGSVEAGLLSAWRALTFWVEERDAEAEQPMRRARALLADAPPSAHTMNRLPTVFAGILARLGRFDEAEAVLSSVEKATQREEDLVSRIYLRGMRATLLYERGERIEALGLFLSVAEVFERGGHLAGALWARAWVGRVKMLLGRRREALSILDEVRRRAVSLGLVTAIQAAERARQVDAIDQIERHELPIASNAGTGVRARAIGALRAATGGDANTMQTLLDGNADTGGKPGYALDRALAHLALATLARVENRSSAEAQALEEAKRAAEEEGVDRELIPALLERLGKLRLVSRAATQLAQTVPDLTDFAVVIDGRSHELKLRRRSVSLRRRPLLRRLLYTLAARPEAVVSKDAIAERLWSTPYNPLMHDNSLWVNTRRLRSLLGGSGLTIEFQERGYRLSVPDRFLFIDPGSVVQW